MSIQELTFKEFLDLTYNPMRAKEASRLFRYYSGNAVAQGLFAKAQMISTDANVRNINYGAPAQDWMNYESNLFSLFPKVPWGPRSGLRFIDVSAATAIGVQENGPLASASNASYGIVEYAVKYHNIKFSSSEKARFQGTIDDSVDRWPIEREKWGKQLTKNVDTFLARPVNTVTAATFIIESLDRMISSSSEATFLVASGGLTGATAADIYPYGQRLRRSGFSGTGYGNGPYDAVVDENAGTLRSLTMKMIDDALRIVRLNGATVDGLIFITGQDTIDQISTILEGKQQTLDSVQVVKTLNGVSKVSKTGFDAGFEVSSYRGIPFFDSKALYTNRPTGGLTPLYGVFMPDVQISVALPALYLETSDWVVLDRMQQIGAYFFGGELVFRQWNTHFKIRDISA